VADVTISPVGSAYTANGSGLLTLNVAPTTAGDLMVFAIDAGTTAASTGVSGGGVTTWNSGARYLDTGNTVADEIWWGVVTSAGSSAITVANAGATAWCRLWARQYTAGSSVPWILVSASPPSPASGGGGAGTGTAVTYPALSGYPGLYAGAGISVFGSMAAGTDPGYTYDLSDNHLQVAWNPAASSNPSATQDNTGAYEAVAVLISYSAAPAAVTPFVPSAESGGVSGWVVLPVRGRSGSAL
jgi:hypothetical protein